MSIFNHIPYRIKSAIAIWQMFPFVMFFNKSLWSWKSIKLVRVISFFLFLYSTNRIHLWNGSLNRQISDNFDPKGAIVTSKGHISLCNMAWWCQLSKHFFFFKFHHKMARNANYFRSTKMTKLNNITTSLFCEPGGGRRSPAVACWASDHWVASSNPLRGKFRHYFRLIIPGVCLVQFSLNNVHKRGIKHHHFISVNLGFSKRQCKFITCMMLHCKALWWCLRLSWYLRY